MANSTSPTRQCPIRLTSSAKLDRPRKVVATRHATRRPLGQCLGEVASYCSKSSNCVHVFRKSHRANWLQHGFLSVGSLVGSWQRAECVSPETAWQSGPSGTHVS